MGSAIVDPAKELAKSLIINTLIEWYSYIKNYHDNMKELQNKCNDLVNRKDTFTKKVMQRNQENLHKSTKLTDSWLAKVQNLIETSQDLIDEKTRKDKDQCCFGRVHCNLQQRYKMSKTAQLKVKEIASLIKEQPDESMSTEPRLDLIPTPNEFMMSLSSRVELMKKILEKLRDDHVNVVGIFGMGAIGKTTLAKEIANKGAKDMFKTIVMVEISESPNVERIQDQIAEQLNVKVDGLHSIEERAKRLYNTLTGDNKILVILDNIWGKIDLGKVGIPQPNENCKLLVTSRMKDVCKVVGASVDSIFEVHPLDENEARLLFRARVGAKADEQEEVVKKMLKKCGGLPLSIVALADVLKNQELSDWDQFATELAKPVSISQAKISGVHRQTYSILETSYKLMESQDKRNFFLLACLFPLGARIPVEEMMRYGIGLGLFQHVNNLIEAMELANTWVDELISSALLLEDGKGFAKVHDVVRASTISLAEKGGNMVMVEAFPRWLLSETCQKYYAISLMSGADHSQLDGLNSDKLQILILDRSQPRDGFSDGFFQGMTNLKVLVLKRMKFTPGLPNSIRKLKRSLRTLLLEECELGDITVIGELTNLVVLSLHESRMEEIPEAIGNLCNLRLLDFSDSRIKKGGIAANVLSKLSLLEGLYAHKFKMPGFSYNDCEEGKYAYYVRIAELNTLSFLKLLELRVAYNDCPIDDDQLQFLRNLDHFFISFGKDDLEFPSIGYSRTLRIYNNDSWSSIGIYNGARVLLEKTQLLTVSSMMKLQRLQDMNDDIQQEEDKTKMQLSSIHFPHLQRLKVSFCPRMQSLSSTPFKAPNLTHLSVKYCSSMKYIFMEHDVDHQVNNTQDDPHITVTFPLLKYMELIHLLELESVTGLIKRGPTTNNDDQQPGHHIFFNNHKTIFPSLEHLKLDMCHKVAQLWEVNCKEIYYSNFKNLQYLEIEECKKFESLGSLSIATALVQLQKLSIRRCELLKEVISSEEDEEINAPTFPCLKLLFLVLFPKLESVTGIKRGPTTNNDDQESGHHILFNNHKTTFPSLEDLILSFSDKIVQLWEVNCKEMTYYSNFNNLHRLKISFFEKLESLGSLSIATALVQLKTLSIYYCPLLREVIISSNEEEEIKATISADEIFPSLESVELEECPELKMFISRGKLKDTLQLSSLHQLKIEHCPKMDSFSTGPSFKTPKLNKVILDSSEYSKNEIKDDINSFLQTHNKPKPK